MDEITRTQRKTQAYWLVDGIGEVAGGTALALVGALLVLSSVTGTEPFGTIALFAMIFAFPASAAVVRALKTRITYPRTGYVKYPEPSGRRRAHIAAVAIVVAVVVAGLARSGGAADLNGPLWQAFVGAAGAAVAAVLVVRAIRSRMRRFFLSALVVLAGAGAAIAYDLGMTGGLGAVWLSLGIASIATGVAAFVSYIREHPVAEPEARS
ncbi:MAG: hypothetical protein D9V44_07860 [Actinobacteria bacterium]|nr:MAG: hypothetical protein D9V44_07860 [Actinomycetota bacterium]